jgi:hypothetical protein
VANQTRKLLVNPDQSKPRVPLTSQISLVLHALGGGQKLRIYGCCADCHADLPHRLAHSLKKGVASVLHQMPAVGDLIGSVLFLSRT